MKNINVQIKKILTVILFTLFIFYLSACGKESYVDDYENNELAEGVRDSDREDRFTFLHEGN